MRRRFFAFSLLAAALLLAAPQAHANQDAVHFFDDIRVPAGTTANDAVCFFCSVRADGEINGSAVVFFGNVHINSAVHQDVVNFFGTTTVADNVSIDGDLVNFFGSIHLGNNATVGKDVVSMFGGSHVAQSASIHGSNVTMPFWIFLLPFLVLFGIVYAIVHAIRERRFRAYAAQYPYPPRV